MGRAGRPGLLPIILLWPLVLATGTYTGPDPGGGAVGVLGSLAHELFFRSALLPGLLLITGLALRWPSIRLPSACGMEGPCWLHRACWGAVAIVLVSLGAGYAWGWQTMRDRTVLWAMAHRSLLWIAGSFFDLSPPG